MSEKDKETTAREEARKEGGKVLGRRGKEGTTRGTGLREEIKTPGRRGALLRQERREEKK